MEMKLAENIRAFRKERKLTQEQLAEVLGVTTGAVHKWEARLSVPDLELIVEMADFFDTSVDVLLGYDLKDNRLDSTVQRLREYRRKKDPEGLAEAEKALKKYPHSFRIVHECAILYGAFGIESGNPEYLLRALKLTEQSLPLLGQNTDPEISEQTLYGKMATIYLGLDETDKAIELLKTHNAGGLYNHKIGQILAMRERGEEAVPFLSEAMTHIVGELIYTVTGYMNVYANRGDLASCQAILRFGLDCFSGLRKENKPNYLDKVSCALLTCLAWSQCMAGQSTEACESLKKAKELAVSFDDAPSYDESDIPFIERIEGASVHDDIGATAGDVIRNLLDEFQNRELTALWESIANQEEPS
jgi:Predicted transcriptional regulators